MSLPAATGSGASVLVRVNRTLERTVVPIAVPPTAAVSLQSMLYVPLVTTDPLATGVLIDTTSCTEPEPPEGTLPTVQVTTPPASDPPAVALTKVVPAGSVSAITTPVALALPAFEYDRVYVTVFPAATGSGASVFEMTRAGDELTVVVMAAPATGAVSLLSMAKVELVISVPFASGLAVCTTSCTEPEAPADRSPRLHVTTPPASVPPPVA